MAVVNKIIHRFIKNRAEYEENGSLYYKIIPYNVQAYSYELKDGGDELNPDDYIIRYVLGTGGSTYMEIASGQGKDKEGALVPELSKEFVLTSESQLYDTILDIVKEELSLKVDKTLEPSKIYGTDEEGNQVTYDKDSFGKVEDVQLNGISVVDEETKIANIEPKANDVDYTTKTFTEVTTVKEALDTIIGDEITFGYTTSTAVGGLPKDTDINNWTLAQVMKQILLPTAVTEPTLSLGNIASTSGVAGSTHKFTKGTIVAVISWTAGTSTNPSNYILTGINADRFEIDGTNIKLKADETFVAGTTGALTFGVSRTYKIVNSLGKTETKTASATNGSLAYSATYPSYVGTTEEIATDFITSITSAIGLKPILGRYAETKNSAYTTYTVPNKEMLTYTNRLVIINKGIYTKIKDASGDITGNFKITSKSLSLYGTATATYTIAVLVNPSAGYKDTLTIS